MSSAAAREAELRFEACRETLQYRRLLLAEAQMDVCTANQEYLDAWRALRPLVGIHERPVSNHERLIAGVERPVSNRERPVSNHERPVSNHERPVSNHELPVSNHERFVSNHERPVSNLERPVTNHDLDVHSHNRPVSNHERRIAGVRVPARPPILTFESFRDGWRAEGHPGVRRLAPDVDLAAIRSSPYLIIKDAELRPAQTWCGDNCVIIKLEVLLQFVNENTAGYTGHMTLGYGCSRDGSPSSWTAWMSQVTTTDYKDVQQTICKTFQGRSLEGRGSCGISSSSAHLDVKGRRILMDVIEPSEQCRLMDLLAKVRRALKLGQVGYDHDRKLRDENRSWHLAIEGTAKKFPNV